MNDLALSTIRDLMARGLAGLDCYDDTRFIVAAHDPYLTDGERALDTLGASFIATSALGVKATYVEAILPQRVRNVLGLDEPDAPTVTVPLASRSVS